MCGFAGFVGSVDDREQVLVNMMNTKAWFLYLMERFIIIRS